MATTTNYGWTTPNDTDLVKDGAAAIRTLGSSVDTTTKNLNPQTTTGALAYRSATANVNTALPIGTAGQILTVNSGATAPEWATPAAPAAPSSNWTLLSSGSVANVTTLQLTASGYDRYILHWAIYDPGTPVIKFRFNNLSATNYKYLATLGATGGTNQTAANGIDIDNFSSFNTIPAGFLEINNANTGTKPNFFGNWRRSNNGSADNFWYSGTYDANITLSTLDIVSTVQLDDITYRFWGL
jgi:hypothetical protein